MRPNTIPALTNASSRFGAAMGRIDSHNADAHDREITLLVARLPWVGGDYDEGGAYWGSGNPGDHIFRFYQGDEEIDFYVRANTYTEAKSKAAETYTRAQFVIVDSDEPGGELLWNNTNYGCDIGLTLDDARGISGSGGQEANVQALAEVPYVAKQLAAIKPEAARDDLREYGTWDDAELQDHQRNLIRLLWLAGGDITDNYKGESNEDNQS